MNQQTVSQVGQQHSSVQPVLLWAIAGAVFLIVQIYAYGSWIASDHFRAVPVGTDPIPQISLIGVRIYEVLSIVMLVPVLFWFFRGIVQTREISTLRLLMIGWLSAYWLDPWLNFLRPMFTYNAYMFNRGCWCEFIPFWQAAGGRYIPEPLLIDAPSYFYTFASTALGGYQAMKWAKRRWPAIGNVGMAFASACSIWLTMGLLDIFATRVLFFDAWPGSFQAASFWGGQFYQFPIYEFVLFPSTFIAGAFVLFYSDKDGLTVLDRGIDQIAPPAMKVKRNLLRALAFVAFANFCNLTYTTAMGVHALYVDQWPEMPSWLANNQCGTITSILCT